MKRFSVSFVVLLMAFVVGATSTYLFHKAYIQFEVTAMGSLLVKPEGLGGFTAYKSFDGVNLVFHSVDFPSNEAAITSFQRILGESVSVINREPLYNPEGNTIVGERVVAMFPPNEAAKTEQASMICLDGTSIYRISSSSLRHILVFDKEHRRF